MRSTSHTSLPAVVAWLWVVGMTFAWLSQFGSLVVKMLGSLGIGPT